MDARFSVLIAVLLLHSLPCSKTSLVNATEAVVTTQQSARATSSLWDNGLARTIKHIYNTCSDNEDIFWCAKVHTTKLLGRALKVQNINLLEGVSLVRKSDNATRSGRASGAGVHLNNQDLENLSMKSLDALLVERCQQFMRSRQLQVNLPRLLAFGQRNSEGLLQSLMNLYAQVMAESNAEVEGRKKKGDDKKYLGPFIAAVMLKAAILKMAYHSIAIVAGKALIVGKIALIISTIIGLKKLVSSEGGEKTTYEIVKHPQVQQSHTYSSSHSGEYEGGGHEGGSYHRSIDDEMLMQDKAYQAWVPPKTT